MLERMSKEAAETERRCAPLAAGLDGKKTAVAKNAKETRSEPRGDEDYLSRDADGLDGLEFPIMAEAGELGHVEIVQTMNKTAKNVECES